MFGNRSDSSAAMDTALATGLAALLGIVTATTVVAEPVILNQAQMDQITAGTAHYLDRSTTPTINSYRQVTTFISMPIANAVAICYQCRDNAYANAGAVAIGNGLASSTAFTTGRGQTNATTFALALPVYGGMTSYAQPYFGP